MKILIVKLSSMGDIIHTLPSLSDAMDYFPKISFDWVLEKDFAEIPSWHPAVKNIFKVEIRKWSKNLFNKKYIKEFLVFKKKLQLHSYNIIIDAQGLLKSALISFLAKGKKHGFDFRSSKESFSSFFYTKCYKINKEKHAIERTRCLFSKILNYKKPLKKGNYNIKSNFISYNFKSYIILLYATTQKSKEWPDDYWRKLIYLINIKKKLSIKLFWKTNFEYIKAKKIAKNFTNVHIFPKLNLKEIAKILISSKFIISVDTGLSHLSASLDCINIALYGITNPSLVGVYGKNQIILKSHDNIISSIYPLDVYKCLLKNNLL